MNRGISTDYLVPWKHVPDNRGKRHSFSHDEAVAAGKLSWMNRPRTHDRSLEEAFGIKPKRKRSVAKALLTYKGRIQSVNQWAKEIGMNYQTLKARIKHGWPVELALEEPVAKIAKGHKHGNQLRKVHRMHN